MKKNKLFFAFFIVLITSCKKEEALAPFSSLSKSGGIVNAYNALIMADSISKN